MGRTTLRLRHYFLLCVAGAVALLLLLHKAWSFWGVGYRPCHFPHLSLRQWTPAELLPVFLYFAVFLSLVLP